MRGRTEILRDFPHGSSGEESTFKCQGRGFDPWLETKIPHATGHPSLPTATTLSLVGAKQILPGHN